MRESSVVFPEPGMYCGLSECDGGGMNSKPEYHLGP